MIHQLLFTPLVAALILAWIPKRFGQAIVLLALVAMGWTFGLSLSLFNDFAPETPGVQFVSIHPWVPSYGIAYQVGVDGISLVLIVLTTFLSLIALLSSMRAVTERRKEFVLSLLMLETTMLGTFAALDLFLFYVFWEAMLIPMYILIGVFGGPRRIYATLKFFLYTMAGSVLMLVAILSLYMFHASEFGYYSTALADLYRVKLPIDLQLWLYSAFLVAFAIKLPLFPFHTWLPDAHVEAPTAGSVLLAGILLKMGAYGLIRLSVPLFPLAAADTAPFLGALGVIGIVYGAYLALSQEDMKKLVAYSSVSHMGFVALGMASLTSLGMTGAIFQLVAHGLSTGSLFLVVGMLYERRHTRMIEDFGGIAKIAPRMGFAFFVILLASIGLPGLCGFVGEFMILTGSYQGILLGHPVFFVAVATSGIVLGAAYMLILYERVFLGTLKFEENRQLRDLNLLEGTVLALPILMMVWLGLSPDPVISRVAPAVDRLVARVSHSIELSVREDL